VITYVNALRAALDINEADRDAEVEANACLLAAAQRVMSLYGNDFASGQDCDHDTGVCWCQGFIELRDAIAKAEGRS